MNAQDIMTRSVVTAARTTSAREVAGMLLEGEFSGVPVADEDGEVVGIVTEQDLIRVLREKKPLDTTSAEEIMTEDVKSVDVNTPVGLVMEVLETGRIIRVPVTEDGVLVGIISRRDVIRAML